MTETRRGISSNPAWAIWCVLGLIVVLGITLRAYRLDELVIFLGDQGRDVTAVWRMVETGEPALFGPGSSFGQFKRGPVYYYLLLSGLTAGGGNPLGAAWTIILLDSATIVLMFIAGRRVIGTWSGLAAAGLYATSGAAIYLARSFQNPGVLAFFSLLVFVALLRLVQGKDRFLPIVVGACVAAWQLHDQSALLILWTGGVLLLFRPRLSWRAVSASVLIALVLLSPFLWYEAQRDFGNLRAMVAYVREASSQNAPGGALAAALERIGEMADNLQRFLPLTGVAHWLVVAAAIASYLALLRELRYNHDRARQMLALYGALPLLYVIWPGPVHSLNLEIVLPIPSLVIAYGLARVSSSGAASSLCRDSNSRVGLSIEHGSSLLAAARGGSCCRRVIGSAPCGRDSHRAITGQTVFVATRSPLQSEATDSVYIYLLKWLAALDCFKIEEIGFSGAYACESSAIDQGRKEHWSSRVFNFVRSGESQSPHQTLNSYRARIALIANAKTFLIFEPASRAPALMRVGTLVEGIRIVRLSPPFVSGEDLLQGEGFVQARDPEAWTRRANDGRIAWDMDAGALALQSGNTHRPLKISRRLQLEPDTDYLVAFEYRNLLQRGAQHISISCHDAERHLVAKLPPFRGYRLGESAEWQPGSVFIHTPPRCVQATMQLRQRGVGTSWFRNVSVRPARFDTSP